jgi:hypothetical protein
MVDGGDGSAHPRFFQEKEVAQYHQDVWEDESWAESCCGSIEIKGHNIFVPEALSAIQFLIEASDYIDKYNIDKIKGFITTFFSKGLPKFTARIKNQGYYNILADNVIVGERFQHPGKTTELGCLHALSKVESLSDLQIYEE